MQLTYSFCHLRCVDALGIRRNVELDMLTVNPAREDYNAKNASTVQLIEIDRSVSRSAAWDFSYFTETYSNSIIGQVLLMLCTLSRNLYILE